MTFFADKSAKVSELCRLARDDMYRIQEHSIEAVDRVVVARDCLERTTAAVEIRRIYGPRYVRGAAQELNQSLELAVRTIAWLWEWRPHRIELERPVELETAKILGGVVEVIVAAGTLKITRLNALFRMFLELKRNAWSLSSRAEGPDLNQMDDALRFDVQSGALGLSFKADDVKSQITEELNRLRRPHYARHRLRRPRWARNR